jgi:hypothetical protein
MSRVAVLLIVAVAGCSSLFGLDVPPNVDRDSDNHRDREDNCPSMPNPDQSDFDRDGAGDACDECVDGGDVDLDTDGIPDGCDGCVSNGSDVDADGIPDNCDGCLESGEDTDGDSIDDACDTCIGKGQDIDGDQIDDSCDECINTYQDLDVDGIDDGCDSCIASGVDADADGVDDACDPCDVGPQHDEDGDGLFDACDNCPAISNLDQADSFPLSPNRDGVGDACDSDTDTANIQTFDPFTTPIPAWYVQGANWSVQGDAMHFLGGDSAYRLLGSGSEWMELRATFTLVGSASSVTGGGFGVFASTTLGQPAAIRVECYVDATPTGGNLNTGRLWLRTYGLVADAIDGGAVDLSQPVLLRLRIDESNKNVACLNAVGKATVETTLQDGGPWNPGLEAGGLTGGFNYFSVVTR